MRRVSANKNVLSSRLNAVSGANVLLSQFSGKTVPHTGGSSFLREMASWPPSWNCDVRLKIRLRKMCKSTRGFASRTLLPNFIPFRFETVEPWIYITPGHRDGGWWVIWSLSY